MIEYIIIRQCFGQITWDSEGSALEPVVPCNQKDKKMCIWVDMGDGDFKTKFVRT
jgi:hypothetical protein